MYPLRPRLSPGLPRTLAGIGHSNCPICRKEFTTKNMQLLFLPRAMDLEDSFDVKLEPDDIRNLYWKPYTISEHIADRNQTLEYTIHPPQPNAENEGHARISRPVLITRLNPSSTFNGRRRYNDIPESNSCYINCVRNNRKCFYTALLLLICGTTSLIVGLNLSKTFN